MRDPAVHIKLSSLVTVLGKAQVAKPTETAMRILRLSVPFTIRDRVTVTGDAKTRKRASRVIAANKKTEITVERFNLLLTSCRTAIGHKSISPIRKGSNDYITLKEVMMLACEFTVSCEIESVEEGCKTYIQLGLELMKYSNQYGLNKFKYYDKNIYTAYESLDMVAHDPKPKRTRKFHDIYVQLLAEYAGIERDLLKPEDYVCFLYARLEADRAGAGIEEWLRSQFEEIGRMFSGIPNPNQLFSVNALKRYYSYVRVVNKKENNSDEDKVTLDWDVPKSDFERKYAEKIRTKNRE